MNNLFLGFIWQKLILKLNKVLDFNMPSKVFRNLFLKNNPDLDSQSKPNIIGSRKLSRLKLASSCMGDLQGIHSWDIEAV